MSLIDSIKKFIPLGRKPTMPRAETLALRPVQNRLVTPEPDPAEEGSGLRLRIPRRRDRVARLLTRWMAYPEYKIIELDEFGAAVWERCDGESSVEKIVLYVSTTYKLNRRQAEVSVIEFLKMLAQRHLIGFTVPAAQNPKALKEKETYVTSRAQRQRRPRRTAWRRH